ncbi:unnamed protein product, partial [Didymodactylos carnosus]
SFKQHDIDNAFIRTNDNEEMPEHLNDAIMLCQRDFISELPPIKWKCRVPVGNGKLCERMDRYKCPFHGVIIARDEQGIPSYETDRLHEQENKNIRV